MSKLTQKYEISVWDVQAQQETKLAIIGANDMLTPARAQSPQLKRNINGTKTLTFSLFTKYVDEIDGERKINPFCNIIHNETRIKLKWKEKWYEFIVKNISEDSENHKNTYVAEDAFISELSRKGFNIELSTDVSGNSGTIIELEDKILENSDWKVDKENSIVGPQLKEDILVKLIVTKEIEAKQKCEFDENGIFKITDKDFKIPVNSIIYGFYSSIYKKDSFFQFFYNEDGYEFGDDGFIINCPIYCISDYEYAGELPESTSKNEITTYKGKKLIRTQESHYDSVIKNYVKHYYSSNNKEIYGYTETEYVTDEFVNNLATNGKDFVTDVGWYSLLEENKDEANSEIEFYTYPSINTVLEKLRKNKSVDSKSYIRITPNTNQSGAYLFYNTGFEDNKTFIETLSDGQKFVIRLKYGYKLNNSKNDEPIDMQINKNRLVSGLNVSLCEYKIDENGYPIPTSVIFKTRLDGNAENAFKKDGDYWTAICECNKSYSKLKLIEANIGLFFSYDFNGSGKITKSNLKKYSFCIEEFEFFEFKERVIESKDTDREYYLPKETVSGEAKIKYNYFLADQEYEEFDDIEFLYRGYKEKNYKQKYIPDYQQIRVIEEKESNIFNLTQTLCESFETWADFVVEHDDLGYIKKDSNGDFIKKIVFKPYVGKENWSGFHYKTNLKSIQRVTESKQITTKSIVKPNYNEFAPSGFCTIAYSDENPSGESFIYDFRYYENQNILNSKTVLEDLQGKKGLYPQLKELNKRIQDEITKRTEISAQLLYLEKDKELYSAKVAELQTSIATNKKDFKLLTGTSYEKFPKSSNKEEYLELPEVSGNFLVILKEINELQKAQKKYNEVKKQYNTEKKNYKTSVNKIKDLTKQKEKLILDFETKYAPFIQEGTWISNEYIDHNLYYIDAKVVAATSALPQVAYTINVLDLSSMEEFKNYNVEIGDKTYITDPEFFGYIEDQGFYTPRRQEVIISEMVEELEEPEKNKFTVQNFKTQFEDIFHRITAATQQLKLNEGAYQRASKAFSNQGLNSEKVQDSFNSSNFTLTNNTNQWDTQGFVSENSQSKQSIKIHDGAIMISGAVSANNSGNAMNRSSKEVENYSLEITEETSTASYNASPASTAPEAWTKIITSKGINANYIYAGQIDAGKINIVTELKTNEDQDLEYAVAFDKDGLSMYGYDTGKKIRLRLGKVLEDDALTELYGLQLYNENGEQTFRTDSEGNITITGTIVAGSGMIGGWGIEEDRLAHYTNDDLIDAFISTEPGEEYSVNDYSNNDWRILLGIEGNTGNFGVTSTGNLFANGVDIKDGNISIGDIFKVTSNGGKDQAMTYGLNIKLNPENQNQEIVIESDDRVIGIRERRQDGKGWTWKTILGDLTNATLGGTPLKDLGMTGYGLCTENGLFSGTIFATSGKIGGWEITENSFKRSLSENGFSFELGVDKENVGTEDSDLKELDLNQFFTILSGTYVFTGPISTSSKEITFDVYTNNEFFADENADSFLLSIYDIKGKNLKDYKITKILMKSLDNTIEYSNDPKYEDAWDEIKNNFELFKADNENLTLRLNMTGARIIELLGANTFFIEIEISADEPVYPTYEYDLSRGNGIPKDFAENIKDTNLIKWISDGGFTRYIFYELYKVKEENEGSKPYYFLPDKFEIAYNNNPMNATVLLLQMISAFTISVLGSMGSYIVGKDSFVRFKQEDIIVYSIDKLGKTKAYIEPEFRETVAQKMAAANSFIGLFVNIETDLEKRQKNMMLDIFSIVNQNNNFIWKGFLDNQTTVDNNSNDIYESIFSLKNQSYSKNYGGLNFLVKDNSKIPDDIYYSFYFDGESNSGKKRYCDLGTSTHPWNDLYLKYYGKILSSNSKGDKVQLLYVSSNNHIVIGYDPTNTDNHLYGYNINLYGQTVNVRNNLNVLGNLTFNGTSLLNKIYPVGSIYVNSSNANPGDTIGGTWTLIKKEYTPKTYAEERGDSFDGVVRCGAYVTSTRMNNFIYFNFKIAIRTNITKLKRKLFNLDFLKHGLLDSGERFPSGSMRHFTEIITRDGEPEEVNFKFYNGSSSDDGDYSFYVNSDSVIKKGDYFNISTIIYLEPKHMPDNQCDKFYWKRTA